jgi:hypothetical protein
MEYGRDFSNGPVGDDVRSLRSLRKKSETRYLVSYEQFHFTLITHTAVM